MPSHPVSFRALAASALQGHQSRFILSPFCQLISISPRSLFSSFQLLGHTNQTLSYHHRRQHQFNSLDKKPGPVKSQSKSFHITMSAPASVLLPHIHMLCVDEKYLTAFKQAQADESLGYPPGITTHNFSLGLLPSAVKFDAVVSPANSYGRLDGGFDDAVSRAFSPREDYMALTRVAQKKLYEEWRGFAPPGTCTLVRMPNGFEAKSRNIWGTKYVALCPTMKTPTDVTWDKEVVYEVVWSLLCAIDKHNRSAPDNEKIRSILMTPMATGYGKVSPQKWAIQTILAMKHFLDSVKNPKAWSSLSWDDVDKTADEVEETWDL